MQKNTKPSGWGAVVAAVVVGVLWAMAQRLKELRRGEEEEAKKY